MRRAKPCHRARDGDREMAPLVAPAGDGHPTVVVRLCFGIDLEQICSRGPRRPHIVVDRDELAAPAQKEREMARAPEAATRRLDDEPGERGGNDSIDSVATGGEHPEPGLGFAGVAGRTDAELGNDVSSGRECPAPRQSGNPRARAAGPAERWA